MLGGIDQHDVIFWIYNIYFEFIVLKYSQIYYKYFQFNRYTELRYHGIENFVMVSKNDIAVLRTKFWYIAEPYGHYSAAILL